MKYTDYVSLGHKPEKNDMVCIFRVEPSNLVSMKEAAGAVAAESSTGTWTKLMTVSEKRQLKLGAKVFEIDRNLIKIAYPCELFEEGNIPQILSSIAGNIFGMKEIDNLRLEDVFFPKNLVKGFKGPELGLEDLRKFTGIKNGPITGSIYKPKIGLNPKEMAENAYKIYSNGISFTKDDENLGNFSFNKFKERVTRILGVIDKIKKEQGRNVIYAPNITAPYETMIERAEFVKSQGGRCIMIDYLTIGWSAFQELRKENLKMFVHIHRALHASITRNPKHGISMMVLAKLARLIGGTSLHTGTIVGKMEGGEKDITDINKFLRSDWYNLKKVMPVASGGLSPVVVPRLINLLGNDIMINFGGGLWGHPKGPEAGACAIQQSVDAAMKGIKLENYALAHKELMAALGKWGKGKSI